ncbi:MAG TPA: hypothetical protein VKQ72_02495 [Aggregatilineales bacterium]|nr:hypothetical protein [Aggregatilineales bacterium]
MSRELPYSFTATLSVEECMAHLKKFAITEPPSNLAFFRLDADTQRFYLRPRAVPSRLVEVEGLLKRAGEHRADVSGKIFGNFLYLPLLFVALAAIAAAMLLTLNLWVILIGAGVGIALIMGWRRALDQAEADKNEVFRLLHKALTPIATSSSE